MPPTPRDVFATLQARPGAVWLDSGACPRGWSILAWNPVDICTDPNAWPDAGRSRTRPGSGSDDAPFHGGCIGYVGYGAGAQVSPVPAGAPTPEPPIWLARYDGALCYRHADRSWHPTGSAAVRRDALRALSQAHATPKPSRASGRRLQRGMDRAAFEAGVARTLGWIGEGDCYQLNLTRAEHLTGIDDPWAAYLRLRELGPAPYGAFLRLGEGLAVLSHSPELFLEVNGRSVRTDPIKGTRPRGRHHDEDAHLAQALLDSAKERAELTMIVDLCRNDLGRVCAPGTIQTGPRRLLTQPNVFHAAREVRGTLADHHDAWSAMAAAFPPGSVTGAPKIRACHRIDQLEPEPRGVYCGAIGFASDHGRAVWSVAIRTGVVDGARARYHVGAGIVADSHPADEWDETVHKGSLLARALVGGDAASHAA